MSLLREPRLSVLRLTMGISQRRSEEGKSNENSYPAAPLRRRMSFFLCCERLAKLPLLNRPPHCRGGNQNDE